jgi:hypothetical protein
MSSLQLHVDSTTRLLQDGFGMKVGHNSKNVTKVKKLTAIFNF